MTTEAATTGDVGRALGDLRLRVDSLRADPRAGAQQLLPATVTAVTFALLFAQPFAQLVRDWWTLPEAGHGLLLAPVAMWLAWKAGIRRDAVGNPGMGVAVLVLAILLRYMAGLAAELFTMRASIVMALGALTIYHYGFRQLVHWWLPFLLGGLAIPLPELVTQGLALPLQFKASQMGAALLKMRDVPVRLTGNVIRIPGNELFVTEACSGLRSLTALLALAVLLGGLVLRSPITRVVLVLLAIPIAVVINGVRVFLTGFLVYFVDPALGKGFMHITEGWLLFLVSLACMGVVAWLGGWLEGLFLRTRTSPGLDMDAGLYAEPGVV
ncbi:MAG: exosortase/archaeosortase family protein [bacterium]